MKNTEIVRKNAITALKKMLKSGQTVYTVNQHTSRSGMRREISLFIVRRGEIRDITAYASDILGLKIGSHEGLIVNGTGMDMGFHTVYNLSSALFPRGFRVTPKHRVFIPVYGFHYKDGGYALNQRWL